MRLAVTAHLTWSSETSRSFEQTIERIRMAGPDCLLVLGPTARGRSDFAQALERLASLSCEVGVVAGPQDLYVEPPEHSYKRFTDELPAQCAEYGIAWLETENLVIGNLGIAGTLAWYDYSGRDPNLGYTAEQYAELKGLVTDDARNLHWEWTDRELSGQLLADFMRRLDALNHRREVDSVLVASHFAPFVVSPEPRRDDMRARFRMAYESNPSLGRILAPRAKVRYTVSAGPQDVRQASVRFGANEIEVTVLAPQESGGALEIMDL